MRPVRKSAQKAQDRWRSAAASSATLHEKVKVDEFKWEIEDSPLNMWGDLQRRQVVFPVPDGGLLLLDVLALRSVKDSRGEQLQIDGNFLTHRGHVVRTTEKAEAIPLEQWTHALRLCDNAKLRSKFGALIDRKLRVARSGAARFNRGDVVFHRPLLGDALVRVRVDRVMQHEYVTDTDSEYLVSPYGAARAGGGWVHELCLSQTRELAAVGLHDLRQLPLQTRSHGQLGESASLLR